MKDLIFRLAGRKDLEEVVKLIFSDRLGATREVFSEPLDDAYLNAFHKIIEDANQELYVADLKGEVVGTFQMTYIQCLTYKGGVRAQIEAVRVKSSCRGKGYGRKMFEFAIERAKGKGAHLLQLTTNKQRSEALRFYESLGFEASHQGLKLHFK